MPSSHSGAAGGKRIVAVLPRRLRPTTTISVRYHPRDIYQKNELMPAASDGCHTSSLNREIEGSREGRGGGACHLRRDGLRPHLLRVLAREAWTRGHEDTRTREHENATRGHTDTRRHRQAGRRTGTGTRSARRGGADPLSSVLPPHLRANLPGVPREIRRRTFLIYELHLIINSPFKRDLLRQGRTNRI